MPDTQNENTQSTSRESQSMDDSINSLPSLLRVVTEVLGKGPKPENDDERYKKQLEILRKTTEQDITNIIKQHEDAVHKKAARAIFDPADELISVHPPTTFGTEDIDETTNREIREWVKDNKNMGNGWPTPHMIFEKMVSVHEKHPNISEEAWRQRLISMFPDPKMRETMEWFRKNKVPAEKYFPHMLKTFKSHMSRSEAQMQLNSVVTNMKANPIEVLEKIEQYVMVTEIDPNQVLQVCRNEAIRYLTLYAGPAMSETILIAYNGKRDDSFRTYIQVAKQFETKIKEEHDKIVDANTKKVRQVGEDSDTSSETTVEVRQAQASQEQRTCHKCKKPGHFIRDCPQKNDEYKKKCYQCGLDDHIAKHCNRCPLHPTSGHTSEDCKTQQADPCTHPAHIGKARHGNAACKLQMMCQTHGNHLQKDCRQQGPNQQFQNRGRTFRGGRQYGQQRFQRPQQYQQGFQGFQGFQNYQQKAQPWGNQQHQHQPGQQTQGQYGQGNGYQQQFKQNQADTKQVQLEQLNQIQQQVGQLVEMANQTMNQEK